MQHRTLLQRLNTTSQVARGAADDNVNIHFNLATQWPGF